ncbi:MAG: ABC transporter ATP-binding protein [Candidatus Onthovivens sp.]|nr:ABC transporter ATP-binding protein [Candidatus Onthovivens sp.]
MNEDRELVIKNVKKVYGNPKKNEAEVTALKNATFSIEKGELVVILGPSGAGKTTLLNILGGMDNASSGDYILNGKNITKMSERELAKFRRNDIGFVFQFYNLMPSLTAYENVYLASSLVEKHFDPMEVLKLVGLEDRAWNFPSQLSGGEQQRVAIARAIVKNPTLILADEPTGALDSKTGASIISLLHNICKEQKKTVIIVTHNKAISVIADRIIKVQDGEIVSNLRILNPKKVEDIER